jgi:hypothetical protein
MSNELVLKTNTYSLQEIQIIGQAMVKSGFFADIKEEAQALVKILAGKEMGFDPFTSINGVHIIQNKPVIAANLMAAAVKRAGKYNYIVRTLNDVEAEVEFFEKLNGRLESIGRSKFTIEEAAKAGLTNRDNWRKYPRNMLFARAISNGIKWYCPDALNGTTVYTPDEMGAPEDVDGNIIKDVTPKEEVKKEVKGKGKGKAAKEQEELEKQVDNADIELTQGELLRCIKDADSYDTLEKRCKEADSWAKTKFPEASKEYLSFRRDCIKTYKENKYSAERKTEGQENGLPSST